MRVLYLVPQAKSPERLGAYTFLDEEIEALASAGIEAFVLSSAAKEDKWCRGARLCSLDARTSVANRLMTPILLARSTGLTRRAVRHPVRAYRAAFIEQVATTIVQDERIDLIHSHFAWPKGLGGAMVRAATGRPLIASFRGTDILVNAAIGHGRRRHPLFDGNVRTLLRQADLTLYFSDYMRTQALSLGARPESARVIRKGVDLSRFHPVDDRLALRQQLGFGSRPMILTVAGLIPLKAIDRILLALARLQRADRDFTFVVCGEGPERRNLEKLSAELGMADRVVFAGRVERAAVPRYFAACDVFVLASIVESSPNVLLEAMAAGRPVVCTDAGGPAEYVSDGQTGFVVPIGDDRAIAARVEQLLDNPRLADALGAEGRRRTIDQLDYRRMVRDVVDVYHETLGRSRRGASLSAAPSAAAS
jgi:glycosyltransferase involved in cell wall biosynthesis